MNILHKLFDEIYGEKYVCFCCEGERLNDDYGLLCPSCYKNLHFIHHPCKKCGDEVNSFTDYCDDCKKDEVIHTYEQVICVAKFDDTAKRLVYKLKYGKDRSISKAIIPLMCQRLRESDFDVDIVAPVPLNDARLKTRGFNQAELLAEGICEEFNLPISINNLVRNRDTVTQTSLSRDERIENLKKAFSILEPQEFKDKKVLIIDDLTTSGATMDEITALLKKKGAKAVYGLTFCHA